MKTVWALLHVQTITFALIHLACVVDSSLFPTLSLYYVGNIHASLFRALLTLQLHRRYRYIIMSFLFLPSDDAYNNNYYIGCPKRYYQNQNSSDDPWNWNNSSTKFNDYSSINLTMSNLLRLDLGGVVGHGIRSDIVSLESGHSTNADPLVKIQYLSR